jgi:hypothetical protein
MVLADRAKQVAPVSSSPRVQTPSAASALWHQPIAALPQRIPRWPIRSNAPTASIPESIHRSVSADADFEQAFNTSNTFGKGAE